jgi:hypothetical protein
MKNITLLILLVSLLSCNKENKNEDLKDFNKMIKNSKLSLVFTNSRNAILSFYQPQSNIISVKNTLYYREMGTETWLSLPISNFDQISIYGLKSYTAYEARVGIIYNNDESFSDFFEFVTDKFSINYNKYYSTTNQGITYVSPNLIPSIETGVHYIYGGDYKNTSEIKIQFIPIDNSHTPIYVYADVVSDSLITFKIPDDLVSNAPFFATKQYYVKINEQYFLSEEGVRDNKYDAYAHFNVINRDMGFTNYTHEYLAGCHHVTFKGFFGSSIINSKVPNTLLDVPIKVKSRKILIYNGASIDKTFEVSESGEVICETISFGTVDMSAVNASPIQYHELKEISLATSLPSGVYFAQVVVEYMDNSKYESDKFRFTF